MNIPPFRPDQTAAQADTALRECIATADRAQHGALLWFGDIMRRKLYRDLDFSTMRSYAIEALGFSETRAGDYIRLATRLEELPVLKEEVASGRLGYTKAREIVPVADRANERLWVQVAHEKSRRELSQEVRHARQVAAQTRATDPNQGELMPRPPADAPPAAAPPVRLSFELTPLQNARYEAMLAKIGHQGSRADLLLDMVEALLLTRENAPRGAESAPHYQVHVHDCPTCAKSTVTSPQGETELPANEREAAACDAQVHHPGQRNISSIPPSVRREVLTRDRHQCRRRGCRHTRFLEVHHLVPRREGGGNEPENLVSLCSACHRLWHEQAGDLVAMLSEVPLHRE